MNGLVTAVDDAPGWFAVWTHSRCEAKVAEALRAKQVDVFLPRIRVPSRRRDRRLVLERPLFPGYVLVRFAPSRDTYLSVVGTDGVTRILGERWDALHAIDEAAVDAIRRVAGTAGARQAPWLRTGDRVRIGGGPLAGLEGLVAAWRESRATFVVNVDLLQRAVAVEVTAALLEPI